MIDPLSLNRVSLVDALIYGIEVDTGAQSVVLTVEVEPSFHKGIENLTGALSVREAMIDIVLSGVRSLRSEGMSKRPAQWADDEKPHGYEVAVLTVRKLAFRQNYELKIQCQLGQTIEIIFSNVLVRGSAREPGKVHNYDTVVSHS